MKVISDQDKVGRFRAFWQRDETDRPLIGATISVFPSVRAVPREGLLTPADLDVAGNVRELEEEWEQWHEVYGDAMWAATPLWAFPWHLAIAGSPVRRDGTTLWGLEMLDDLSDLDRIRFDPNNPWFRKLVDPTRALVERSRGRWPVTAGQLVLGPVDMLSQIRGQERFALDLYDSPELVTRLAEHCTDYVTDVVKAHYELIPSYFGGYAGTNRFFWAPGKLTESAEDLAFMTSPALHRKFIVPIHRRYGQRMPYQVVHLHSAQLHTVPNLLEVDEIAALQISPDFGEDMIPHIEFMGQILK